MPLTIWCNTTLQPAAHARLAQGIADAGHTLVLSRAASADVHAKPPPDPALLRADIALGQPDVDQCIAATNLRWVAVTTAGYTRYEREDFFEEMRRRQAPFTNASSVFADPCAQHVLAMMLALGRQLLASHRDQLSEQHPWDYFQRRFDSRLLTGQTVVLLGFGAIGRRLVELLQPFKMKIYALRRRVYSERGVHIIPEEQLTRVLPEADHVINILPANDATLNYVNARRLACCKPGARFYNVGRGTTVDQNALLRALESGRLGAAYLDVTAPEPLPPEHPLWTAPRCYITPHTAGGMHDQDDQVAAHFLANLACFTTGAALTDRVV